MVSPSSAPAMTEHSRCQPGRPSPHGDGQTAPTPRSAGWAAFQSAKSRGSAFANSPASMRERTDPSAPPFPESLP